MRQHVLRTVGACFVAGFCILFATPVKAAQDAGNPGIASSAHSLAHYIMGFSFDLQGKTPEALKEYQESLRTNDKAFAIHLRMGMDLARVGKNAEAIASLTRASQIYPEDLQTHYLLALMHSSQRDFDRAAVEYETILKSISGIEPKNAELYLYLGQLYEAQNKPDKAQEQYDKALALDPKNTDAAYTVGSFYLDSNRRAEAIRIFQGCIDSDPFCDTCLNALAYLYAEDNTRLDEAKALALRALEIDPGNGAYLDSLGWIYYRQGMYVEALKELNKAIGIIEDPVIYDHLGDVYLKLGQPDMAKKLWRMSLGMDPGQQSVKGKLQEMEKPQVLNQSENK